MNVNSNFIYLNRKDTNPKYKQARKHINPYTHADINPCSHIYFCMILYELEKFSSKHMIHAIAFDWQDISQTLQNGFI